jgi:hypothetical protein
MMRSMRFVLFVCLFVSLLGCKGKGAEHPKSLRAIDVLRVRAEAEPSNAALWTELALSERFDDGGEPARAQKALERAKSLKGDALRLSFTEAEAHVLEGRPSQALDAYFKVLELAPGSSDPLAAGIAEASLSSLSDMNDAVDDYRPRLDKALEELASKAGEIGLNAAHQLRMQRLGRALLRGDVAAAQSEAQLAGCVQKVDVAGPFGPREMLGFDETLKAEKGALEQSYDLGVGRGTQPTRRVETRRCVVALGRGAREALGGTSIVRAEVDVKQAGPHALRLESPNSIVVWVDGKEVVRLDLRRERSVGVRYVPLVLSAGRHEIRAKVTTRHPNPALSLALVKADAAQVAASEVPAPNSPFARYLVGKLLLSRGDAVFAREVFRVARASEPPAAVSVMEAAAVLADPLRPAELRRDRARELLRRTALREPSAWYPVVGLAALDAADGRTLEAIEALRGALERFPEVMAIRTNLIEQLRAREWTEEADRVLDELRVRMPNACAVTAQLLSSARARSRAKEIAELTEEIMRCDATSTARLALLRATRRYEEAADELERLVGLGDVLDPAQALAVELQLAELRGDETRRAALRAKHAEEWPERPDAVLDRTDVLAIQKGRPQALSYLSSAIQARPDDLYELRHVAEALGGENLFSGFRKDGAEVISAFEASGRSYAEPQVLVLDYTVVRVFEDGSSVDLTHNIMRMQSQEAVDENGEFGVPSGARLLRLHTIKADGTRLEPQAIDGKNTLSLPNLAPNDYVEFEFMRAETPSVGFPGGFLGDRFYFRSFEVPFDHSELVVILPASVEPVIDPRGPAPETIVETKDGLKVLRWAARESRPLPAEPLSVSSREFLPSINIGFRADWAAYVESLRDLLADKDLYDPEADQMVRELLKDLAGAPASRRAQRLFRWVTEEIEATDDVFGLAPAMLAARTGSRERVLRYMLGLAGIDSELALVRGAEADHSKAVLPDPDTFGYLLLRVQTERGPLWLHAGMRDAPFGYLPAHVHDEPALMLSKSHESTRTPALRLEDELRQVKVELTLSADGSAEGRVRETLHGLRATSWRNDLDGVPAAELHARFEESYVARLVPGARLVSLEVESRDDPEAPLVLDFRFEVASIGHRAGKEWRVPPLFTNGLSTSYARVATRTVPELIAGVTATDVSVELVLPKGAKVVSLPKPQKLAFAGQSRFETKTEKLEGGVRVERSLRMPVQRVDTKAYPELAAFCRAVDLSEATEIAIKMP